MKFIVSAAAIAAAAFIAMPASAATYIITGVGQGVETITTCRSVDCSRTDTTRQTISANVIFYVDRYLEGGSTFPRGINSASFTYWEQFGQELVNFQSINASGQPFAGEDLLLSGRGSGDVSFFSQTRLSRQSVSVTFDFTVRELAAGEARGSYSLSTSAVPEPATWAMMIGGFGLVGGAMRRRRTLVAA